MANWHTNNLTGSDTTGDGSAGNPYKTITKAATVAAAEDTIKVAGSELSDVSGITLTSTGSNVFTTSVNPTGIIAANDIISITHPQLGADKFFYRVVSITTTSITLNETFDFGTGLAIRKFTTPSYSTATSNTTFEAVNFGNKRFDITGGWNSDFTAQTGWTIAAFNTATATTTSCTFITPTSLALNTYFEKFAFFSLATGFGGNTTQTNYGDLIATRVASLLGGTPKTKTGSAVNWYIISASAQSGATTLYTNGKLALKIENVYTINRNSGISPIQFANISLWIVNCYQINQGSSSNGDYPLGLSNRGGVINNLNMYANGAAFANQLANTALTSGAGLEVNSVTAFGSNASYAGFASSATNGTLVYFNTPTTNMSNFRWIFIVPGGLAPMPTSAPNIYIKDIEGNKFADGNTIWFADSSTYVTGNNSLKLKNQDSTINSYPTIANLNIGNATSSIVITIKVKSSQPTLPSMQIVAKTPSSSIIGETETYTLTGITSTFQDKTITITDAATINKYKNGLLQLSVRMNPNFLASPFIWIDSVVVAIA